MSEVVPLRPQETLLKRADQLEPGDRLKPRNRARGGPVILSTRTLRNGMVEVKWGFEGFLVVQAHRTFEVVVRDV
jgi:hypothetical protein